MPRSSIRRLFNAANALAATGWRCYRLDIGDPNLDLPERIADGITEALARKQTHYSPMPGITELREAIAAHMWRRFGLECGPDQIVCNQGATQALNACLHLTCDHGESILLPEIYWQNYIQQTTLGGVRPLFYELDERFVPRVSGLAAPPDAAVRALLINSPGNPTGALFPPQVIRELYAYARQCGIWIISDEAYCDYVYTGEYLSPLQIDMEYQLEERRVLGVFSSSKSYAAPGLRMGWTIAPRAEVAALFGLLNEPLTGSLTTPLQVGVVRGLEVEDAAERREVLRSRWRLAGRCRRHGYDYDPPGGGLFYFVDISSTRMCADEFADRLLAEQHVAVVPGSGFGLHPEYLPGGRMRFAALPRASNCVRVCFAVPEDRLLEGVTRLAQFIRSGGR